MNRSVLEVDGNILIVSQFTLHAQVHDLIAQPFDILIIIGIFNTKKYQQSSFNLTLDLLIHFHTCTRNSLNYYTHPAKLGETLYVFKYVVLKQPSYLIYSSSHNNLTARAPGREVMYEEKER